MLALWLYSQGLQRFYWRWWKTRVSVCSSKICKRWGKIFVFMVIDCCLRLVWVSSAWLCDQIVLTHSPFYIFSKILGFTLSQYCLSWPRPLLFAANVGGAQCCEFCYFQYRLVPRSHPTCNSWSWVWEWNYIWLATTQHCLSWSNHILTAPYCLHHLSFCSLSPTSYHHPLPPPLLLLLHEPLSSYE